MSMVHFWKKGASLVGWTEMSPSRRVVARFDGAATPRVLHLLDLSMCLGYLATLSRYALSPPNKDTDAAPVSPTVLDWILIVYSFVQVLKRQSLMTIPFVLTLLALLLSMVPTFSDIGYSLLLVSISLHILQLHLCYPPGPMFLFPPEQTLPLATVLWHGVSRIFFPVIMFFLPALLLTVFLLSVSLGDVLPVISPFSVTPSPLELRSALVVLFTILFGLLICSLVMLILVYPSLPSRTEPPRPWDRYSNSIGEAARRAFAEAVVNYSSAYLFIPPFNLLQLALVRWPTLALRYVNKPQLEAQVQISERVLWRFTVGLLACGASIIWIWEAVF